MMGMIVGQVSEFTGDLAIVEQKTDQMLISAQRYIEKRFAIPVAAQTELIKEETKQIGVFIRSYLTGVLRSSVQLFAGLLITLVLTFLFLFHKEKYYAFFLHFAAGHTDQ